jgi:hypothetical protein
MSELADRLRAIERARLISPDTWATVAEAAAELDRLGSILGAAAHYTDAEWATQVFEQMGREAAAPGPLFPPPSLKPHNASMLAAADALGTAQGYWERHLQVTGGR